MATPIFINMCIHAVINKSMCNYDLICWLHQTRGSLPILIVHIYVYICICMYMYVYVCICMYVVINQSMCNYGPILWLQQTWLTLPILTVHIYACSFQLSMCDYPHLWCICYTCKPKLAICIRDTWSFIALWPSRQMSALTWSYEYESKCVLMWY